MRLGLYSVGFYPLGVLGSDQFLEIQLLSSNSKELVFLVMVKAANKKMLCSLWMLESVCRKELCTFPSLPALLGLLVYLLISHSFLHWPNATWVNSSFHYWKWRSKDIFTSVVFCSSQAELRCISGLFVEGNHPLPLLHHFFLIPPVPTWRYFNLFFSCSGILVACEVLHSDCCSRAILL